MKTIIAALVLSFAACATDSEDTPPEAPSMEQAVSANTRQLEKQFPDYNRIETPKCSLYVPTGVWECQTAISIFGVDDSSKVVGCTVAFAGPDLWTVCG